MSSLTCFSSTKSGFGLSSKSQWKRFMFYNIYAWGVPLFLIFSIWFFNEFIVLPYEIHPFMGKGQCFIEQSKRLISKYHYEMPLIL